MLEFVFCRPSNLVSKNFPFMERLYAMGYSCLFGFSSFAHFSICFYFISSSVASNIFCSFNSLSSQCFDFPGSPFIEVIHPVFYVCSFTGSVEDIRCKHHGYLFDGVIISWWILLIGGCFYGCSVNSSISRLHVTFVS